MTYKVKGSQNRGFEAFDDSGNSIGKLDYPSFISANADITLSNGNKYHIAHSGFFGMNIDIEHNDNTVGTLKFNWKGQMIISLGETLTYAFKRKGFWHQNFVLQDEQENELAMMNHDFEWSKMSHTYDIIIHPDHKDIIKDTFLLFIMVYAANHAYSTGAGAA